MSYVTYLPCPDHDKPLAWSEEGLLDLALSELYFVTHTTDTVED
jgi:hypothetical protein